MQYINKTSTMLKLSDLEIIESKEILKSIPECKILINTVNAHSFNVAQKDELFADALRTGFEPPLTPPLRKEGTTKGGDSLREEGTTNVCVKYLIPDGASIIKACKLLKAKSQPKERIAGWDLFAFEMRKLNDRGFLCAK